MHEYYCRACRRLFTSCLKAQRCPTQSCQSQQIKDINTPRTGVLYRHIESALELAGKENENYNDSQGRSIRQSVWESIQEELEDKRKAEE